MPPLIVVVLEVEVIAVLDVVIHQLMVDQVDVDIIVK